MPESATAAALGSKVFSIVDKFGAKNREKTNLISTFAAKFNYIGSYRFGADDSSFYAITSGVSGLCEPSQNGSTFSVKNTAADSPY